MTESKETERKAQLGLGRGKLELRKTVESGQVRQQFPHGRQKTVQVEIKRKRGISSAAAVKKAADQAAAAGKAVGDDNDRLTGDERTTRLRALQDAMRDEEVRRRTEVEQEELQREQQQAVEKAEAEVQRQADEEAREKAEENQRGRDDDLAEKARRVDEEARQTATQMAVPDVAGQNLLRTQAQPSRPAAPAEQESEESRNRKGGRPAAEQPRKPSTSRKGEPRRRAGKLTISQALDGGDGANERIRSLASVRRQREREKQRLANQGLDRQKISRDVVIPEFITVQELANRMAERAADVIKSLMKMGVMANINQSIDADTAELLTTEFGHKVRRVSAADVEIGLKGEDDKDEEMISRAPVVTVMGHVDHGKTSLLDAIRKSDVAGREAGGITQHIGAYQVTTESGGRITFIDTPGHAAFTEMRARGANVTDIVILVVAADDGIMPQTIEAINHAKSANVPMIIAINKCDKPDANPDKVRQTLLSHEVQVENLGGEVQDIEVSATTGQGLQELLEAISLQSEILELKANPNRGAEGVIIEAKLEQGRGAVATALIQKGTLRVGDIFVAGAEWGKVRAMLDEHGDRVDESGPASPVEVLGLTGAPLAGDDFIVVENEARAREVTEFRQDKIKEAHATAGARGTVEQIFSRIQEGEADELPIVIKTDVQGSLEAIAASLEKMATSEVKVNILHSAVGGINESDITLARASGALVVGFNVRANPQARVLSKRDGVEIRYYSIIYELLDDSRALLSGMLAPEFREQQIGLAEIREIFNITKTGKVAGCFVTEGVVRRGSGVRLLRDDVVIHEGKLKTLRRFKEEVKEVSNSYECGMAFENYQDLQVGDVIECFEKIEVARQLEA